VTARAGTDRVDGVGEEGELRVRVRVAAGEGRANEAVLETLAGGLGIGRSRLSIVRGHTARRKVVDVLGVDSRTLAARWQGLRIVNK
jgi:uncharacterized protein YggU (UPF0235/DUF167 family)